MLNRNDTGWNRHNGVGATLLENWVEERAVGAQVLYERENIKKISTTGHEVKLDLRRHLFHPSADQKCILGHS